MIGDFIVELGVILTKTFEWRQAADHPNRNNNRGEKKIEIGQKLN